MQNQAPHRAAAQGVQSVADRLTAYTAHMRRARRRLLTGFGAAALICMLVPIGIMLLPRVWGLPRSWNLWPLLGMVFVALFTSLSDILQKPPPLDGAEMARTGGVQAIAPLFAALQFPMYPKERRPIEDALTLLLPQMRAADADLLSENARRIIHQWLSPLRDSSSEDPCPENLRVAALVALPRVGDFSLLPDVKRLANLGGRIPGEARVRQAALDCLPALQALRREAESKATLLRASQAGEVRPDTLLRSAFGPTDGGSGELLRADSTRRV